MRAWRYGEWEHGGMGNESMEVRGMRTWGMGNESMGYGGMGAWGMGE